MYVHYRLHHYVDHSTGIFNQTPFSTLTMEIYPPAAVKEKAFQSSVRCTPSQTYLFCSFFLLQTFELNPYPVLSKINKEKISSQFKRNIT